MNNNTRQFIIKTVSLAFTIFAFILLFKGDLTNGLLAAILGEVIDMEKIKLN